jgi:deoxyhypusine synthase
MAENGHNEETPSVAKDAVFKVSESVPDDAREVQGIDFNRYTDRNITVDELLSGMTNMGFQATSVGEAVRIINEMVGRLYYCGTTVVPEVDVLRSIFQLHGTI